MRALAQAAGYALIAAGIVYVLAATYAIVRMAAYCAGGC